VSAPAPSFAHLRRLTDDTGLFEHAEGRSPRELEGYCVDDVARALVTVSREPIAATAESEQELAVLGEIYLKFTLAAQAGDGRFHNRFGADRRWQDRPGIGDCWGRALWGLGTVVSGPRGARRGHAALESFGRGAVWHSPWRRPMAYAALGAAEVLAVFPEHREARTLLVAAARRIGRPRQETSWPWPEDRLTYANALLPEALLAAGTALGDESLQADGLSLLGWLLEIETGYRHLSVTPVGGRGPGEVGPAFDQQPIEVAALAEACGRAYALTGDRRWAEGVQLAVAWFLGDNDAGTPLHDAESGGGCDGLEPAGRNENQGAESTLAVLSTLQQVRRLRVLIR
jgi:hypothetical protein